MKRQQLCKHWQQRKSWKLLNCQLQFWKVHLWLCSCIIPAKKANVSPVYQSNTSQRLASVVWGFRTCHILREVKIRICKCQEVEGCSYCKSRYLIFIVIFIYLVFSGICPHFINWYHCGDDVVLGFFIECIQATLRFLLRGSVWVFMHVCACIQVLDYILECGSCWATGDRLFPPEAQVLPRVMQPSKRRRTSHIWINLVHKKFCLLIWGDGLSVLQWWSVSIISMDKVVQDKAISFS